MQLEQVDVVCPKPYECLFYRLYQVIARRPNVVWSSATTESSLGREDEAIAWATLDRTAEHLFGSTGGIDVGCVEHIDASLKTDIDQMARFDRIASTPGLEELPFSAECAGAEAQDGDTKAGCSKSAKFHLLLLKLLLCIADLIHA